MLYDKGKQHSNGCQILNKIRKDLAQIKLTMKKSKVMLTMNKAQRKINRNEKVNDRTKDKALRYLTGHYENLSVHGYQASVRHQDKLKLLKFPARIG